MPVRVGDPAHWQVITPTTDWQYMPYTGSPERFQVATDLYYITVEKTLYIRRKKSEGKCLITNLITPEPFSRIEVPLYEYKRAPRLP